MAKCFRDLSYICIILFIVLGWHIMDNIVSEKEVDITSLNIKYTDNQLVTVIKIQMICKCKYKTI